MNRFLVLLLATVASTGAKASEVGAPIPQLANSPAILAVAIAEAGASAAWALEAQAKHAPNRTRTGIDEYVERAFDHFSEQLQERIFADLKQHQSSD